MQHKNAQLSFDFSLDSGFEDKLLCPPLTLCPLVGSSTAPSQLGPILKNYQIREREREAYIVDMPCDCQVMQCTLIQINFKSHEVGNVPHSIKIISPMGTQNQNYQTSLESKIVGYNLTSLCTIP